MLRRWGMQDDVDKMRAVLLHRPIIQDMLCFCYGYFLSFFNNFFRPKCI